MTSAQKAKGGAFERDAQNHGRSRGHTIERLRATGPKDEGDLALFPAEFYKLNLVIPAVLHKRRMRGIGQAYLTMEYDAYLEMHETINRRSPGSGLVTIIEAKNRKSMDLAEWIEEAKVEAVNWKNNRGYR